MEISLIFEIRNLIQADTNTISPINPKHRLLQMYEKIIIIWLHAFPWIKCHGSKCGSLFLGLLKDEHLTLRGNINDPSSPNIPVSWEILEFPFDISLVIAEHHLLKTIVWLKLATEEGTKDLRNLSYLDNTIWAFLIYYIQNSYSRTDSHLIDFYAPRILSHSFIQSIKMNIHIVRKVQRKIKLGICPGRAYSLIGETRDRTFVV